MQNSVRVHHDEIALLPTTKFPWRNNVCHVESVRVSRQLLGGDRGQKRILEPQRLYLLRRANYYWACNCLRVRRQWNAYRNQERENQKAADVHKTFLVSPAL
jgi:hypothetical protein